MPSIPDARAVWTSDDARRFLDEWKLSGCSLAEFARRHGIDPARVYWWRKRLATASPKLTALSLVPATVVSPEPSAIPVRYIDWLTMDKGTIGCVECKASATAPLTRNQTMTHPEIERTGAVVVGSGKPGFPGGTVIPPTRVQIRRP